MSATPHEMSKAKMLVVGAVCIALAFALNQVALFRMPMGGSVTPFSMMFIVLAGYWLGPIWGIVTGVSMGLLDMATGFYSVHIGSVLLDYPIAFGALGLSGFFRKWRHGLQIGYIVGVLGRFISVFFSGYLFWLGMAPGAFIGSAVYNGTYILPEMIATLLIISLPTMKHAIDAVTKSVVSPADYAVMSVANKGSVSVTARIVTGAVLGAAGGFAFALAGHLRRIEELTIVQLSTDALPFYDPPRADRLYRLVERNTEQIFALNTAGIVLLAIGAALLISVLAKQNSAE